MVAFHTYDKAGSGMVVKLFAVTFFQPSSTTEKSFFFLTGDYTVVLSSLIEKQNNYCDPTIFIK